MPNPIPRNMPYLLKIKFFIFVTSKKKCTFVLLIIFLMSDDILI